MEIFSLDLGNKQTKLKSSKKEYVLPSSFMNLNDSSENIGWENQTLKNHIFKVPFDSSSYIWGKDVYNLGKDDYLINTIAYSNRYKKEPYKLLANFALGVLARDFIKKDDNKAIDVALVVGLPTDDYHNDSDKQNVRDIFNEQHQITVDGKKYVVNVKELYILPQPVGTLYDQLLDSGAYIKNEDLQKEKVGIVDIGGGTVLIDTLINFGLSNKNRNQFDNGIDDLYESIKNRINGSRVSIFKVENSLRNGTKNGSFTYEFSKEHVENITEIVKEEINLFTNRVITQINSTFKDMESIDTLLFTGGGSSLVNENMIKKEFKNANFVDDTELANVRGFYKFGLTQKLEDNNEQN